jgi:hypothetical protein
MFSWRADGAARLEGAPIGPVTPVRVGSQSGLVIGRGARDESVRELLKSLRATRTLRDLDNVRVVPVVKNAYLEGPIVKRLRENPVLADVEVRLFDVLDGPSVITRGLPPSGQTPEDAPALRVPV